MFGRQTRIGAKTDNRTKGALLELILTGTTRLAGAVPSHVVAVKAQAHPAIAALKQQASQKRGLC